LRAVTTTVNPRPAKSNASDRPIPELAPVTQKHPSEGETPAIMQSFVS
jgi:hypothetical protein